MNFKGEYQISIEGCRHGNESVPHAAEALEQIPLGLAAPGFYVYFMLIKNKNKISPLLGKIVVSLMVLPARHTHTQGFAEIIMLECIDFS